MKEQLEHHHKEEEAHLFPKVEKMFSRDELDALCAGGYVEVLLKPVMPDAAPVPVRESGFDVTVYDVIGEPLIP